MLITPHAVIGAAIGVVVPHPVLAIPLAIGSHFVLDSIPHWQEIFYPYEVTWKTWVRIPIDASLACILVLFIMSTHPEKTWIIALTTLCATFPDGDCIISLWKTPLKNYALRHYYEWHCRIQKETSSLLGLLPQAIVVVVCLFMSR